MSQIKVVQSVSASPAQVWAVVGNPFSLDKWHPAIVALEGDNDTARSCTLPDGAVIHEKIRARDDAGMRYEYTITESPLPVKNYRSILSVEAAPEGAVITWEGSFEALAAEQEMEATVRGVYEAGLTAVKASFES